jgi:(R,R)-butanediol dehydrogenase/meso-butanediol dehydrogenase/diacetyl reductase
MLALRWHGRLDIRLEEVELTLPLDPDRIEIEVAFCGICGSDLAEYRGGPFSIRSRPHSLTGQGSPVTLGHEFSGRIVAVGSAVKGLSVGDRVAADACWRCGECPACRAGSYNLCPDGGSIGLASDGGFASRVRFPSYCAVPLPDEVSDEAGALLEPLAVALHALDRGHAKAGDVVVVLGFGPIGAAVAVVARAIGLSVLVSEPQSGRRAKATSLGFETQAPEGDARDVTREIRDRTGGGAELVLDCTGIAAVLAMAPDMTTRGGTVVLVGLPKKHPDLDAGKLVLYERSIIASLGYVHDLPRVAKLIAAGSLDATQLISGTVALRDAPSEFARLTADPGDSIKVLVSPEAA